MRADKYFSEKFSTRTKAAQALERGVVLRNGRALKPSDEVREGDEFVFLTEEEAFVSNGGYKLSRAISAFQMQVEGKIFADLGASTGGFTDCLLQNGAQKVYAVDVGESLLDGRIAQDERVVVMDRTNARYLDENSFPERIDAIVSDLSFISLKLVLPAISRILREGDEAFLLIKPQFEVGKKGANKSGIVPPVLHGVVLSEIYDCAITLSLAPVAVVNAPVKAKKNIEYVAKFIKSGAPMHKEKFVSACKNIL